MLYPPELPDQEQNVFLCLWTQKIVKSTSHWAHSFCNQFSSFVLYPLPQSSWWQPASLVKALWHLKRNNLWKSLERCLPNSHYWTRITCLLPWPTRLRARRLGSTIAMPRVQCQYRRVPGTVTLIQFLCQGDALPTWATCPGTECAFYYMLKTSLRKKRKVMKTWSLPHRVHASLGIVRADNSILVKGARLLMGWLFPLLALECLSRHPRPAWPFCICFLQYNAGLIITVLPDPPCWRIQCANRFKCTLQKSNV